jgi:hypothetical protein
MPLHLQQEKLVYYRIVYRGVVALLSGPDATAPRSGSYLSYGEIIASRCGVGLEGASDGSIFTPQRGAAAKDLPAQSTDPLQIPSLGMSSDSAVDQESDGTGINKAIRVDAVLTGGYAVDATKSELSDVKQEAETPRRSNTFDEFSTPNYCPVSTKTGSHGFLLERRKDTVIAERLTTVPKTEEGRFHYKIMSSTPLPILTGPSIDAPRTKASLLPGTVQEISLRVSMDPDGEGIWFLRLSHRRGWIADRKVCTKGGNTTTSVPVVKEIMTNDADSVDDGSVSVLSSVATTSTAPSSAARRRHRPPRRRRDAAKDAVDKNFPRHVGGKIAAHLNRSSGMSSTFPSQQLATPSSNVSILSDDSSLEQNPSMRQTHPTSPDASFSTTKSVSSSINTGTAFYLMRVTAPRGLKILDAPQFQVNTLIRGKMEKNNVASSHLVSQLESNMGPPKMHHSIFQTMSGRTTGPSKTGNPAVFDASSKTRVLPRGAVFEASKRMESTGAFNQGDGLIKLSDNSGWAIVPSKDDLDQQYRSYSGGVAGVKEGEASYAYEEVGNAIVDPGTNESQSDRHSSVWIRVLARTGLEVSCPAPPPPQPLNDEDTSPTSSRDSSAISGSNAGSNAGQFPSNASDVASSVGSSFIDAMFRSPAKKEGSASQDPPPRPSKIVDKQVETNTISCGMIAEVEEWVDTSREKCSQEYARLRGGQGWLPMFLAGRQVAVQVPQPEFRFGSIWFRVQSPRGIKVRLGPSKRAPSIKSEDGVYFRFECGEFLRASEVVTVFSEEGTPIESFAKLYRNRHVRLHMGHEEFRGLPSLTAQAEWVQIYNGSELFLEECAADPRIERHKQGWRYNVVPENGVAVRRGPSFAAEKTGIILFGGESVLINERVSPTGDKIAWLRMKDGQGWIHDVDDNGERTMIPHSLRHRSQLSGRQRRPATSKEGKAYNTIIARLFHSEVPEDAYGPPKI